MATSINAYSVSLGLDASAYVDGANLARSETAKLKRDIESARTPAENFAREQDRLTKALNSGAISQGTYNRLLEQKRTSLLGATSAINPYAIALGAAAAASTAALGAGVAFVAHLRSVQGELDSTAKAATKAGLSFTELSSIRFAAGEIGGMEAGAVDTAMKKLQINAAKAMQGDKTLQDAFARAGVDAATVLEKGPLEAVKRIADGFQGVTNHAEKLALAAQLFGKAGADMVSTLQSGRSVLEESTNFQEKWNSLTDAQIMGVEANNDAWGRIGLIIDGLSNTIAAEFAPAMHLIADVILETSDGVTGIDEVIRNVVDTTVYLAGVFKDIYELATVVQTTLYNISTLNFSAVASGINAALDISSGEKAVMALYEKRFALEKSASEKQRQRELERQKLIAEGTEETASSIADAERQKQRLLDDEDRKRTSLAQKAISNAEKMFADEQARSAKIRDGVAAGPGSGMEAGSAEAAKFMADQVNAAIGADAVPELPTPGEVELLTEARRQAELLEATDKKQADQLDVLKYILEESKTNGFSRIR